MADNWSGTGQVAVDISGDYKQAFLSFLSPQFYYVGFGNSGAEYDLQQNKGTQVKWERPAVLPVATTAYSEYVTPEPLSRFSTTVVTATIAWHGDYIQHSDRMVLVALNRGILSKIREMQTQQYKNTLDQLCRDAICAGTNKRMANGTLITDVNTVAVGDDFDYCINFLQRSDVLPITKKVTPSQLYLTQGLRESYIALSHVDMEQTIKSLTGYVPVAQYANPGAALPGEIGSYRSIRFIVSSNGKIALGGGASGGSNVRETSSVADVYYTPIFGKDFYGETKLAGKGFDYIVKPAGSAGAADPLNQRGTAGWTQAVAYTILDNARGVVIYSAAPSIAA